LLQLFICADYIDDTYILLITFGQLYHYPYHSYLTLKIRLFFP
jgi:hypothetical protein